MITHRPIVSFPIDFTKPIQFGKLWNCDKGNEKYVIVFDDGSRHAVCSSCAAIYTGPVFSLAIFNLSRPTQKAIQHNCNCGAMYPEDCTSESFFYVDEYINQN